MIAMASVKRENSDVRPACEHVSCANEKILGGAYLVWRRRNLDVDPLHPASQEKDGDGSVQQKQRICREHKPLFFVLLQREHDEPNVESGQPKCDEGVWAALAGLRFALESSEALEVGKVRDEEHGPRRKRKERQDVEIEQQVQKVEVRRLRAVQIWSTF